MYIGYGHWDEDDIGVASQLGDKKGESKVHGAEEGEKDGVGKQMMVTPVMRFVWKIEGKLSTYDCLLLRPVEGRDWVFERCGKAMAVEGFFKGCAMTRFFVI